MVKSGRWFQLGMNLMLIFTAGITRAQTPVQQSYSIPQARGSHEFVFKSSIRLKSVAVAGTFNNWSMNANQLSADATGKTWRATLRLPLGKHFYKFVLNGSEWLTDPAADKTQTDNMGNAPLVLFPSDYSLPARPHDGITARSALLHPTYVPFFNYDRGQLTLSLRTRTGDLKQVALKIGNRRIPMLPVASDDLYAFYSAQLAWDRRSDLAYVFELIDGTKTFLFGVNGAGYPPKVKPFRIDARQFTPFITPEWIQKTIFYQIFPDRFADGDKTNDPPNVAVWSSMPTGDSRFGGDVQGVRDHLPYLSTLGISSIYFTPIYKSPSSHRYDIIDYKAVDPQFGTNADFAALTRELKAKDIRTVMDFVFNHSDSSFPPFADVCKNGAASIYKDWYFIQSYPVHAQQPPNYQAFGGWWGMPRLNEANPATRDYMLDVVNFWSKEIPLAGVRLDVADQLDGNFLRSLRQRVKTLNPNTWIVGETWGDASTWLMGDQWDAAMNYPFLFSNVDFFAEGKITPTAFTTRLMQLYSSHPPQVSRNMMNSLSTHDTPRFLTRCNGDQNLQRLAAAVQFTWVGAPCIYYGEELGMQGGQDPDNRRGMEWNRVTPDNAMLSYYKRLVKLRRTSRALQSGVPAILMTDDNARTLAYSRTLNNELAIVAINRSDKPQTLAIPMPDNSAVRAAKKTGLTDGLTGKRYSVGAGRVINIMLKPLGAVILL